MKISFSFGTQKNVDIALITGVIENIVKMNTSGDFSNLHAGTGTVYINLYDKDGIAKEIVTKNGESIEYIIRGEPYRRLPKNTSSVGFVKHKDTRNTEVEQMVEAYVYEKYR